MGGVSLSLSLYEALAVIGAVALQWVMVERRLARIEATLESILRAQSGAQK